MTISAWDSFAVSEKWTMDDNNLLKLLFFVLFFFFSSSRWKPVSSSIKLSGRLLLWAADLMRNRKKDKSNLSPQSCVSLFTDFWTVLKFCLSDEKMFDGLICGQKKKTLAVCVYPKSLSSVSVRDSFLVTLTDVCSHKSCFIKRFFFVVHCVLIVNI